MKMSPTVCLETVLYTRGKESLKIYVVAEYVDGELRWQRLTAKQKQGNNYRRTECRIQRCFNNLRHTTSTRRVERRRGKCAKCKRKRHGSILRKRDIRNKASYKGLRNSRRMYTLD